MIKWWNSIVWIKLCYTNLFFSTPHSSNNPQNTTTITTLIYSPNPSLMESQVFVRKLCYNTLAQSRCAAMGCWGGLRGLFFQDLTYLSSGRRSYESKGAVRLPSVMAAEIICPHNAFNYVAVASETGGRQNGSKAIWERVSRQLTSFCPPLLSDGGWPLDNTPEQQQRLGANVYKLLKGCTSWDLGFRSNLSSTHAVVLLRPDVNKCVFKKSLFAI